MFEGFTRRQIKTQDTTINLVRGGSGYPILLLHGYPRTHVCWHRVAPTLAERFTVVCPDLRGYGDSATPPNDPAHRAWRANSISRTRSAKSRPSCVGRSGAACRENSSYA